MAQIVKKITMVNGQVTGVTGGTVDSADLTAVVAAGIYGDATHYPVITLDAGGQVTGVTLEPASSGSGTVTSVGMTVPAGLAVAGSPITTSGTLALTWSGQIPIGQRWDGGRYVPRREWHAADRQRGGPDARGTDRRGWRHDHQRGRRDHHLPRRAAGAR